MVETIVVPSSVDGLFYDTVHALSHRSSHRLVNQFGYVRIVCAYLNTRDSIRSIGSVMRHTSCGHRCRGLRAFLRFLLSSLVFCSASIHHISLSSIVANRYKLPLLWPISFKLDNRNMSMQRKTLKIILLGDSGYVNRLAENLEFPCEVSHVSSSISNALCCQCGKNIFDESLFNGKVHGSI